MRTAALGLGESRLCSRVALIWARLLERKDSEPQTDAMPALFAAQGQESHSYVIGPRDQGPTRRLRVKVLLQHGRNPSEAE